MMMMMMMIIAVVVSADSDMTNETFKCYKDIFSVGIHYCVEEKERCYNCADIKDFCNSLDIPSQCIRFCVGMYGRRTPSMIFI